jgi:hypothetical protein
MSAPYFNTLDEFVQACERFERVAGRIGTLDEVVAFDMGRRSATA